jgi:beta-galactosidase
VLDLIGYNYHQDEFKDFRTTYSQGAFIASETTSALATRGYYEMKSDSIRRCPVRWDIPYEGNPEHTCSSYDNCSTPWGSTHEESWRVIKKYDFLSGMFIWTGFDYLGEPTPYWWPSRSSYFGILDLAGFPKDAYYMYQSEWTDKKVLHLFPHWNWKEGDSIDMWVYTNFPDAELFLNGTSMGKKVKGPDDLHLQWRLSYTAGEVMVKAGTPGVDEMIQVVRTAGKAARIELSADRSALGSDGRDLAFVTARVLDENGTLVPFADNLIKFSVKGDAKIKAVDNGDPVSHEPFISDQRRAFYGMCLLVVQSGMSEGNFEITAESEGLPTASLTLSQSSR